MIKSLILFIVIHVLILSNLYANTIHVPGDSSTIQAGIDGAATGDTILIADGTYTGDGNRDISWGTRDLYIIGSDADNVIIDIQNSSINGFYLSSSNSEFKGISIINGNWGINVGLMGSVFVDSCKLLSNQYGAGHDDFGFTVNVRHCQINNNAIYGINTYSGTIEGCRFEGNGTAIWGKFVAINDTIVNGVDGIGGIRLTSTYANYTADSCYFENMTGVLIEPGGGNYIRDCIFLNNSGTLLQNIASDRYAHLIDCNIQNSGNIIISSSGDYPVRLEMIRCLYVNGSISSTGSSVLDGSIILSNSTFINTDVYAHSYSGMSINFDHNIFYFDTLALALEVDVNAVLTCNDIYNGSVLGIPDPVGTDGNIADDPRFCDKDNDNYFIADNSPCAAANNDCGELIGMADINCSEVLRAFYVSLAGDDLTGDGSDSSPFYTIQHAIDQALDGDTVIVKPGTYTGPSNYNLSNNETPLVIIGEKGADSTIIDVEGNDANAFNVDNTSGEFLKIIGITIANAHWGVLCDESGSTTYIDSCIISSCDYGVGDSSGYFLLTLKNSTIKNCSNFGFYSKNNDIATLIIDSCTFESNSTAIHGTFTATNCLIKDGSNGISGNFAGGGEYYNISNSIFENLDGIVIYAAYSSIVSDCEIKNNSGVIIRNYAGRDLTISNCNIYNNTGPGIELTGNTDESSIFNMSNCTYYSNAQSYHFDRIQDYSQSVSISNCIFAFNSDTAIYIKNQGPNVSHNITNTIIVYNEGYGISLDSVLNISCSDVFGNIEGNYDTTRMLDLTGLDSNISLEPRFCDPDNFDFNLAENSPCAPNNNSCSTLIGALPVNCDTIIKAWYIAITGDDVNGDGSLGNPFATIQRGIDNCISGDSVIVEPGTYTGDGNRDIDFLGKSIIVMSSDGPELTILDCEADTLNPYRGFYFHNGEDTTSIVNGFTIKNGLDSIMGGGVLCSLSSPTIENCILLNNIAGGYSSTEPQVYGGGMCCIGSSPIVKGCVVEGNIAWGYSRGGGIYCDSLSSPVFEGCEFRNNMSRINSGGGIYCKGPKISFRDCYFFSNDAGYEGGGGGLYMASGDTLIVSNCIFEENQGDNGAAIICTDNILVVIDSSLFFDNKVLESGQILNLNSDSTAIRGCTFSGNVIYHTSFKYIILVNGNLLVENNIIAFNVGTGLYYFGDTLLNNISISCNNIYDNTCGNCSNYGGISDQTGLNNNISVDPRFCDISNNDFNLGSNSPCAAVNSECGELIGLLDVNCSDIYRSYYVSTEGNDTTGVGDDYKPFYTIQHAIDQALDGDTVIVKPGTYTGDGNRDIDFGGKSLVLMSEYGADSTIIDGDSNMGNPDSWGRAFIFQSNEDSLAVVSGFTITRTKSSQRGGIVCNQSSPKILNCKFINNQHSGALYCTESSPYIIDCLFENNRAGASEYKSSTIIDRGIWSSNGGAIKCDTNSNPAFINCTFKDNIADACRGGAVACDSSSPAFINCSFINNFAYSRGGAVYSINTSSPSFDSCSFLQNYTITGAGGAIACSLSSPTFSYCLISDNYADDYVGLSEFGGGLYLDNSSPLLDNCTIVKNHAYANVIDSIFGGAGIYCKDTSSPIITNCIIAFNGFGGSIVCNDSSSIPIISFTDIYGNDHGDWIEPIDSLQSLNGNMSFDPLFCDTANGDFHIDSLSPCAPDHPLNSCSVLIGALEPECQNCTDVDSDGICEPLDNCNDLFNPDQADGDSDGIGDFCDTDISLGFSSAIDGWQFENSLSNMWLYSWNNGDPEDERCDCYPILAQCFPSWSLFQDAFGEEQTEYLNGSRSPLAEEKWHAIKDCWSGSCFGFAISSFLFFDDYLSVSEEYPGSIKLYDVLIDDQSQNMVNKYWIYQFGNETQSHRNDNWNTTTPSQTLQTCKDMINSPGEDNSVLSFWNNGSGGGGRSVNPYRCEQDGTNLDLWYIYIYDNNHPGDDSYRIVVNTNTDTWFYSELPAWGGSKYLFMEKPSSSFTVLPSLLRQGLPKNNKLINRELSDYIEVYHSSASEITLESNSGIIGYTNESPYSTLSDGMPIIPTTGYEMLPIGHYLPNNVWDIYIENVFDTSTNFQISFVTNTTVLLYERDVQIGTEEDQLRYDGDDSTMMVFNPSSESRSYDMTVISVVSDSEIVCSVENIEINPSDSTGYSITENSGLQVDNYGDATSYTVRIQIVGDNSDTVFYNESIPIDSNTTHSIEPNWQQNGDSILILVDEEMTGVYDDTLVFDNEGEPPPTCCELRGDVSEPNDGVVLVNDLVMLVNYVFKGGIAPSCLEEGDCAPPLDGLTLINDLVYLVNYVFKGGAVPPDC